MYRVGRRTVGGGTGESEGERVDRSYPKTTQVLRSEERGESRESERRRVPTDERTGRRTNGG